MGRSRKAEVFGFLVTVALLTVPMGALAVNLGGSTVTSQYYAFGGAYNFNGSPATFVADGTIQQTFCAYSSCDRGFTLQINSNRIIYTFFTPEPWFWSTSPTSLNVDGLYIENGNLLTFHVISLDRIFIDPKTDMPGFGAGNLTTNSRSIAVNWAGLTWQDGQQVVLKTKVPEPGTLALLLSGLVGLGVITRRRKAA